MSQLQQMTLREELWITSAFEGVQKQVLYNNPPYIKIIKRDRIWQQRGCGSIDIHRDVQHKYFEIFYQEFLNTTGMCMNCGSSVPNSTLETTRFSIPIVSGVEQKGEGGNKQFAAQQVTVKPAALVPNGAFQ